jgi:hypothetical protein
MLAKILPEISANHSTIVLVPYLTEGIEIQKSLIGQAREGMGPLVMGVRSTLHGVKGIPFARGTLFPSTKTLQATVPRCADRESAAFLARLFEGVRGQGYQIYAALWYQPATGIQLIGTLWWCLLAERAQR